MRRRKLGHAGIEVSELGFGCVRLTSQHRRHAVRMLEHSFSLGITHFDVARLYGFGRAEAILGDFLRGKRDRVTVATKLGLLPPAGLAGNRHIVNAAKRILSPFPRLLRIAKKQGSDMITRGAFTPREAIDSLEKSLRELGTDYVDVLLLHESSVDQAADERLLEALERQLERGTVRCLGIASDFATIRGKTHLLPARYRWLQFNDNAATRNRSTLQDEARSIVTHSIFQPATAIARAIEGNVDASRRFSAAIGADLRDGRVIHSLLLKYALWSNREGMVLFSTTSLNHATANAREIDSTGYDERQLSSFIELVDWLLGPASQTTSRSAPT
jgi:aryl-alcohol dehydrogenase-like predicted oxidoreductase